MKNEDVQTVFSCVDVSKAAAWHSHVTNLLEVVLLCHMDNVSSAQIHTPTRQCTRTRAQRQAHKISARRLELNPPLLPPPACLHGFLPRELQITNIRLFHGGAHELCHTGAFKVFRRMSPSSGCIVCIANHTLVLTQTVKRGHLHTAQCGHNSTEATCSTFCLPISRCSARSC